MKQETKKKIKALLDKHKGANKTTEIDITEGILRINMQPENIRLWKETLDRYSKRYNLLLACESEKGDLKKTKLTWVVGSAIRAVLVNSPNEVIKILENIGVNSRLANLTEENCPGLGNEITWAFYLDRHGSLSASPVLETISD